MYGYLAWVALLGIAWLAAYAALPALRRKILWSSLIALPFGFGDLYFIPNYWTPRTLFDLGTRYHVALEGFALMFFLGGIAAAVYEGAFKKRVPVRQKICHPFCKCYTLLVVALAAFLVIVRAFPEWNVIYPSAIACLAGGSFAMLVYPRLRAHILFGGIVFALLYWVSLAFIDLVVPGWIANAWNMGALSSITLLAVPIEEIFFGFAFGTLWAPLFEEVCTNLRIKGKTK